MPKPKDLETIDPTALATVSGGASRNAKSSGDDSSAVMTALNGILESINSLAKNQNQGMSSSDMFLMMMMMQNGGAGAAPVAAPAPTNWTWDANGGYWIVK